METLAKRSVRQIRTTENTVYAFVISGQVDDDAAEAMATVMNEAFDRHDKVSMLLDLSAFTGSDWESFLERDVIRSRWRSLSHVERYAVIGAPDYAARMIATMDKLIPVDARAFHAGERDAAWQFVGAQAL